MINLCTGGAIREGGGASLILKDGSVEFVLTLGLTYELILAKPFSCILRVEICIGLCILFILYGFVVVIYEIATIIYGAADLLEGVAEERRRCPGADAAASEE